MLKILTNYAALEHAIKWQELVEAHSSSADYPHASLRYVGATYEELSHGEREILSGNGGFPVIARVRAQRV